ncbi:NLRC3, partial [Symbiodinium sp. CCMP2592]
HNMAFEAASKVEEAMKQAVSQAKSSVQQAEDQVSATFQAGADKAASAVQSAQSQAESAVKSAQSQAQSHVTQAEAANVEFRFGKASYPRYDDRPSTRAPLEMRLPGESAASAHPARCTAPTAL